MDRISKTVRRLAFVGVLGWLATLGVDFFLHAGVFAGVFFEPSPFLLTREALFVRIPLGYLAFLLLTGLLVWLMAALSITGWWAGARFGVVFGGVVHGSGALALASVSTASPSLLVVWFLGQSIQAVVAGAVVGSGLQAYSLRRLGALVVILDVVLIAITAGLQVSGLVPTPT